MKVDITSLFVIPIYKVLQQLHLGEHLSDKKRQQSVESKLVKMVYRMWLMEWCINVYLKEVYLICRECQRTVRHY